MKARFLVVLSLGLGATACVKKPSDAPVATETRPATAGDVAADQARLNAERDAQTASTQARLDAPVPGTTVPQRAVSSVPQGEAVPSTTWAPTTDTTTAPATDTTTAPTADTSMTTATEAPTTSVPVTGTVTPAPVATADTRDAFLAQTQARVEAGTTAIDQLERAATERAAINALSPQIAAARTRVTTVTTAVDQMKAAPVEEWTLRQQALQVRLNELEAAVADLQSQVLAH